LVESSVLDHLGPSGCGVFHDCPFAVFFFMKSVRMISVIRLAASACVLSLGVAPAVEYHVSPSGKDANPGTRAAPFKSISAAAGKAMPGDTVTVHEGTYRERIDPPRGGESDAKRITYQAAKGEQVVITGAEVVKGWEHVQNDTWKVTLPGQFFGDYNPFGDLVCGDYFISKGPAHTGAVYLNGAWLTEAYALDPVLAPASEQARWFATAPGKSTAPLLNVAWFSTGGAKGKVSAISADSISNLQHAASVEGGGCLGYIRDGSWATYKDVSLDRVTKLQFRVSADTKAGVPGSRIEVHLDNPQGPVIGTVTVPPTKDWQTWQTVETPIKPTAGTRNLALVFKDKLIDSTAKTTIWAQFKGVDPNTQTVEVNVRPTVFSPSKPGIDYITVRGFTLRQAATQWAPPTAGQIGIVSAYWNKGWIIEDNEISHSICAGVALGKYFDKGDNFAGNNSQAYTATIDHALANGWNKDTVGHHIVRNNHIHHCEQNAVVGSLGCAFSQVIGNEIHDIHTKKLFSGYEMAGVKFHGFIDGVIRDNHIYNTGCFGIWLDWMCQGAQVTGNLLHNNGQEDIFLEMQHGPLLLANNIMISGGNSIFMNSKSIAFAHNLITGGTNIHHADERRTPWHKPHSTEIVALHDSPGGDHRFYNNLFTTRANTAIFDKSPLPSVGGGNVYTKGAQASQFDGHSLRFPDFDAAPILLQKNGEWRLTISTQKSWMETQRPLVTSELLGKAKIPNLPYENADGSPIRVDTDYFGKKRDASSPFPGPFETPVNGEIKVWPKN
jgi:alpha-L-arabinofuranosidase